MNPKQIASERAMSYVEDGMVVGLGTGSTTAFAVMALGARVRAEGLRVRAVPTSDITSALAMSEGIALADWETVRRFDISIDGADEVDPALRMIKGGGGALLREKIVASRSDHQIIIVDSTKEKAALGGFALPVAVAPFGWQSTRDLLEAAWDRPVVRRTLPGGEPYISDDGLVILDIAFGAPLPSPDTLVAELKRTVGVLEVGLFVGLCHRLVIGYADGRVEERLAGS